LGLDIGFSITKATNSFCLLYVDEELIEIGLVEPAKRFLCGEALELFRPCLAPTRRSGGYR
jgi:hypothetical protein